MNWTIREKTSDELYHYGVKGMKWGVRKEYEPKGRSSKSDSSKSLIKKLKNSAVRDETIKTRYGDVKIDNYDSSDYKKAKDFVDFIAEKYPDRYMDSDQTTKYMADLPKQDGHWRTEEMQIKQNNHDPQSINDPRWSNCFKCSMAYEMRMRGYDVQAKPGPHGGWSSEAMHCFDVKDAFAISFTNVNTSDRKELAKEAYRQMEKKCLSYGDGARGTVGFQYYDYDSGHSMYWVVENGEFRIIDSQATGRDGYDTFLHADTIEHEIEIARLDNADILPGIADFVEPFEKTSEELAKEQENAKKLQQKRKDTSAKKVDALREIELLRTKERDKQIWNEKSFLDKARSIVSKAVKHVKNAAKKTVSSFSKQNKDDGRSFVEKLFNIKSVTKVNGKKIE